MKTRFNLLRIIAFVPLAFAIIAPAAAWSTQPVTRPSRTLLETTHDACGENVLRFSARNGGVFVPFGQTKSFAVSGKVVHWTCGGSPEVTRCPDTTNFVEVIRTQDRRFTVKCFRDN